MLKKLLATLTVLVFAVNAGAAPTNLGFYGVNGNSSTTSASPTTEDAGWLPDSVTICNEDAAIYIYYKLSTSGAVTAVVDTEGTSLRLAPNSCDNISISVKDFGPDTRLYSAVIAVSGTPAYNIKMYRKK